MKVFNWIASVTLASHIASANAEVTMDGVMKFFKNCSSSKKEPIQDIKEKAENLRDVVVEVVEKKLQNDAEIPEMEKMQVQFVLHQIKNKKLQDKHIEDLMQHLQGVQDKDIEELKNVVLTVQKALTNPQDFLKKIPKFAEEFMQKIPEFAEMAPNEQFITKQQMLMALRDGMMQHKDKLNEVMKKLQDKKVQKDLQKVFGALIELIDAVEKGRKSVQQKNLMK